MNHHCPWKESRDEREGQRDAGPNWGAIQFSNIDPSPRPCSPFSGERGLNCATSLRPSRWGQLWGHGSRGLSPHQITPNQSKSNPNESAKIQVNPTKSDLFFIPVRRSPCPAVALAKGDCAKEENLFFSWPLIPQTGSSVMLEKTQKRLNEPNSKNVNPPLNIDDFTDFDFFEK
jgi:hypothetical protein